MLKDWKIKNTDASFTEAKSSLAKILSNDFDFYQTLVSFEYLKRKKYDRI